MLLSLSGSDSLLGIPALVGFGGGLGGFGGFGGGVWGGLGRSGLGVSWV